jgi:hypothetical protein
MPLRDVHMDMVQERPLQSTGVTMVNNLYASGIDLMRQQIISTDMHVMVHMALSIVENEYLIMRKFIYCLQWANAFNHRFPLAF